MTKFFYRVQKNECVIDVCKRFNLTISQVVKLNGLKQEISCGDLLYLEREDANCNLYRVQPFDTPYSLAKKFKTNPEKILEDNGLEYLFYGLLIKI